MSTLEDSIAEALTNYADDYDIPAIAEELRGRGYDNAAAVDEETFWTVVDAYQLPDEADERAPAEVFRAELAAALEEKRPTGAPAVWKRGGVTLEITGASRVSFTWPQPGAKIRLSTAGDPEAWILRNVGSWDDLWSRVEDALTKWAGRVAEQRAEVERARQAHQEQRAALAAATLRLERLEEELGAMLPDEQSTAAAMTVDEVAAYLGIAPGSVRKQMSRWGIEAFYERNQRGPAGARYPAAEVQVKSAQRPGRGARTDLARR